MQAGGGACPVRFRCAGCDHFRTDVSHLPDLTIYLDDLLQTRERLAAAIDGVDEWARADATPSQRHPGSGMAWWPGVGLGVAPTSRSCTT